MKRGILIVLLIVSVNCILSVLSAQEFRNIIAQEGPMMITTITGYGSSECYLVIVDDCKACKSLNESRARAFTFAGPAFAKGTVDKFIKKHDAKIEEYLKCKNFRWSSDPDSEDFNYSTKIYFLNYKISCKK